MSWPIEFTFHGEPLPAKPVSAKSVGYKLALTAALNAEYGHYSFDIPLASVPGERSKWMKNNRYGLIVKAHVSSMIGEWHDFGKVVSQVIEKAGVIANANQIDEAQVIRLKDKDSPRIEIKLWRI